jgi:hypothetical protein
MLRTEALCGQQVLDASHCDAAVVVSASFSTLQSLVVAYSRRKLSVATSRRSSSTARRTCHLGPPSSRSGAWWWRTRGGRRARRPRGGGAPRSPINRVASPPRTSLAPRLRALPSHLTSAHFPHASPPRPSVPLSAASLEKRGSGVGGHGGGEKGEQAQRGDMRERRRAARERSHAVRMGAAGTCFISTSPERHG